MVRDRILVRLGRVFSVMVRFLYFISDDKGNFWKIWVGMIRGGWLEELVFLLIVGKIRVYLIDRILDIRG